MSRGRALGACALSIWMLAASPPRAAVDAARTTAAIDALCARSSDLALSGTPARFVSIFGKAGDGKWRAASPELLERVRRDPNIYSEVADAWTVGGAVAIVHIAARSLEIGIDTSYCFRPQGSLARVMESSSGAAVRDDEVRYFDDRGRPVSQRSKFYPIYPRPGKTLSPDLRPSTPTLYRTARALPFYKLMVFR